MVRPVINLDRPVSAGYNPVPGGNVNLSATTSGPLRLAGEVVEESPGAMQWFSDLVSGGKAKAASTAKGAAKGWQGLNAGIYPALAKNAPRVAAGTGILTVLSAAGELADEDDPFARNAVQAVGNGLGGWIGVAGGALLGSTFGPVGTVIGGIGGGILGTDVGSKIAGGIYDAVTGETPEERRKRKLIAEANIQDQLTRQRAATENEIMVNRLQAQMPLIKDGMAIKRQDDMLRAERELRVQNDYNYANALNQAMLQAQNNAQLQNLAMTQFMMG